MDSNLTTSDKPRKKKRRGIRTAKITEPDSIKTDIRDYRPRVILGGKMAWDFSGDNIQPRD